LTVKVWPPIVSVPVRGVPAMGLTLTLKVMVLLPVPDGALVTAIQSTVEEAVHVHDAPVVNVVAPPPPDASTACPVGDSE
jgi:hypothetical protein